MEARSFSDRILFTKNDSEGVICW